MVENQHKGTYAGVLFSKKTIQMLEKYMSDNNIPNALSSQKLHSTVLYSSKYLSNYKPLGQINPPWIGKFKQFNVFQGLPKKEGDPFTNCLVLEYECPEQVQRFNYLMKEYDATYNHEEYKTHVTLSYNIGDFEYQKLPPLDFDLEIIEEYQRELISNWTDQDSL